MGLLERIGRMIRANITNLIQEAEDPEKMLEQAVMEMQQDLLMMRQGVAAAIATQKRTERQMLHNQELAQEWYQRAQLAVAKGAENLAKEALIRRQTYHHNAQILEGQITQEREIVNRLKQDMRTLEIKISDAKMKKDLYLARARSAVASQRINELTGNLNNNAVSSIFERIEEKIMTLEAQSEVTAMLNADPLERQFKALESGEDIETEKP